MRRTLRELADARKELLEIQQEFTDLQKRIHAVQICIMNSLNRIFGDERPALARFAEEELIETLAGRVAEELSVQSTPKMQTGTRHDDRLKEELLAA